MKLRYPLPFWVTVCVVSVAAWISPTHAQRITRGPYLQRGYKDSAVVRFRTDTPISPTVKVGTTVGSESLSFNATGTLPRTELDVVLSGLEPSTTYYYKVMTGSTVLAGGDTSHYFVTSPNEGDEPFNVWALGDSGISATLGSGEHPQQARVRDSFLNVTPLQDLSFLIHLGDIAYYEGTDTQFQRGFFDIYPTILRTLTTWPTQGNHDYSANAYYNIFSVPQKAEAGGIKSESNRYYSWNFGNAHFISVNSERTSSRSAMDTWLRSDLSANTKTWTIVIFHHPPYTKGSHDSDNVSDSGGKMQYMRETVLPILEQYGVDLVMSGHSHSYERSFLLNGHYGNSSTFSSSHKVSSASGRDGHAYTKSSLTPQAHSGTVYLVAGSGGMLDAAVPLNHPAMFTSTATLGSMLLAFNANELTVKFITDTATTGDYFTIRKDSARARKPATIDVQRGPGCGLDVTWSNGVGASSYKVYRSENRHSRGEEIASNVTGTSYTDPAPTPGTTHYYSVRGVSSNGSGPWSDIGSGVVSPLDTDGDGVFDCADQCPNTSSTDEAGACGCGKKALGTFPNGTVNCSAPLTPRRVPSSPLVTSSRKIVRITMDTYTKGVGAYHVTVSRGGRVIHRVDTKRSTIALRPNWRGAAVVRYQIRFQSGLTTRRTRWSPTTRIP